MRKSSKSISSSNIFVINNALLKNSSFVLFNKSLSLVLALCSIMLYIVLNLGETTISAKNIIRNGEFVTEANSIPWVVIPNS